MKDLKKKERSIDVAHTTPGVRLRTNPVFGRSFAGGNRCSVRNCGTHVDEGGTCENGHQQLPGLKK